MLLPTGNNKEQKNDLHAPLHLLSFNAWALPIWLPNCDQKNRYNKIPIDLLEFDADILCLQETFSKKFRKKILPLLEGSYYTGSDNWCNKVIFGPFVKDCHGGLITFSKFPVLEEYFFHFPIFSKMRFEERIGAKGFLLSKIQSPKGIIYVINTHLYAGMNPQDESLRLKQIKYMHSILLTIPDIDSFPTFFLGDLNVRHPDISQNRNEAYSTVYSYIVQEMRFKDPAVGLFSYTSNDSQNPYRTNKERPEKLDYILIRDPIKVGIQCNGYRAAFTASQSISDHYGWSSQFDWSQGVHKANKRPQVLVSE